MTDDNVVATSSTGTETVDYRQIPPHEYLDAEDSERQSGHKWIVRVHGRFGDWIYWRGNRAEVAWSDAERFCSRADAYRAVIQHERSARDHGRDFYEWRIEQLPDIPPGKRNTGISGRP